MAQENNEYREQRLVSMKALAQLGGTAAGGYGGFKAGERLWLG
jgi:hypothetical protein